MLELKIVCECGDEQSKMCGKKMLTDEKNPATIEMCTNNKQNPVFLVVVVVAFSC